ncbi:MAG: hypothetical protein WD296_07460 [Acidimicrobiia bacterium]
MRKRTIGAMLGAALIASGIASGVALASGGEGDGNVTGPDADRAIAAALSETGGTTANSVERDSENGAVWEVEVAKSDGSTVDVRLDGNMHVIVVEPDSESDH